MCGLDMRELQPAGAATASAERPLGAAHVDSDEES